jgi:hypothetical protein
VHRACLLSGVKQTWRVRCETSAFDPKRTLAPINTRAGRFDVTRSASSALGTHDEVYSEVAQTSGDAIQLNRIGTVQLPITAGQPKKIRNTWKSATTPKITLAIIVKVFWLMAQCGAVNCTMTLQLLVRKCRRSA